MKPAEKPLKEFCASTVYPAIKGDFERLLKTTPKRIAERGEKEKAEKDKKEKDKAKEEQPRPTPKRSAQKDKDPVQEKIGKILGEVKEHGERRNVYMNLAWTGPMDNTFLQDQIPLGKVENMAADLFLRSLPTDVAAETVQESQGAADDVEAQPPRQPQRRAVGI